LKERYEAWRAWHRAADELFALDDRSLADIGLSRSDIPYIVSHHPVPNSTPIRPAPAETLRHAA
jgi:uncharacterized protein YjiS (DUF1127 family)